MSDSSPIRVLQVVPSLGRVSGVANFVYNMECYHDENRVHYDFLHHAIRSGHYVHQDRFDDELEDRGSAVYTVNYAGDNLLRFTHEIHDFFNEFGTNYDIVHCHMPNTAFSVLREAKRYGVKNRILHSHLNRTSDIWIHDLRNRPLNYIGKKYATDYIACSQDAGRFLFKNSEFTLINNGIRIEYYTYDESLNAEKRREFGVERDDIVIGCVGRFVKQKNLEFAIRVFSNYHRIHPHSKLILLGDGDGRGELESVVQEEHLTDAVLLPGVRSDVNQIYSAMDAFLMPSLCEGLPVSAIEAQAAGLPCLYSDNVPRETDITGTGIFLPLPESVEQWTAVLDRCVNHGRLDANAKILEEKGYSAKRSAELLMQHYERLAGRE